MNYIALAVRIIPVALKIIPLIEELVGEGNGEAKRRAAVALIVPIVSIAEAVVGKDLVDEAQLASVAGEIVDAIVKGFNETGVFVGKSAFENLFNFTVEG